VECAFCGQALRPGATFCAACGADVPVPGAPPVATPAARAGAEPANPRAATALLAMPLVFIVSVIAFSATRGPGGGIPAFALFVMTLVGGVVAGVAWAVWRGASWARWLALVATLGWGAFMAFLLPGQVRMLRDPYMTFAPARESAMFGIALGVVQVALAALTAFFLLFPRKRA